MTPAQILGYTALYLAAFALVGLGSGLMMMALRMPRK